MKSAKSKIFLIITFVLCAFAILTGWLSIPYFLADYQYNRLIKENVKTKTEAEKMLFLYNSHRISIANSLWSNTYKLQPGEYCQQYMILNEPIDIIYNSSDEIVVIFSSYE